MNNMPHKDPTLATALLAWLMDNWPAVYGALLAPRHRLPCASPMQADGVAVG